MDDDEAFKVNGAVLAEADLLAVFVECSQVHLHAIFDGPQLYDFDVVVGTLKGLEFGKTCDFLTF